MRPATPIPTGEAGRPDSGGELGVSTSFCKEFILVLPSWSMALKWCVVVDLARLVSAKKDLGGHQGDPTNKC